MDEQVKKLELKQYEIGDTLRINPFGRVRIAKHKKTNKYYALKIIKKKEILESKQGDHIINEIAILKKIKSYHGHPFCISLDGITQNDKCIFMTMDLINGGELFNYLRGISKLQIEEAR